VRRRRLRHSRSNGPTWGWELTVAISWRPTLAGTRPPLDYLPGHRSLPSCSMRVNESVLVGLAAIPGAAGCGSDSTSNANSSCSGY
jgi:hypothetical protein